MQLCGGAHRESGTSIGAAIAVTVVTAALVAAASAPIQATPTEPPGSAQIAELWRQPERNRDLFWGVGGKRLAPDPNGTLHRHRDQARRLQPRLHRDRSRRTASGAPSFRRRPRPKWSLRGCSGASATTSRRSTTSPSGRPRRPPRRTRSCRRAFARSSPICTASRATAIVVVLRESVRRHAPAERPARAAGDARQLRSEGRAERALHARETGSRARRAGTSRAISGRRSAAPALLDPPRGDVEVFERDAVHHAASSNGQVRFDYRGRHKALFANITPADVRWICERSPR